MDKEPVVRSRFLPILVLLSATLVLPLRLSAGDILIYGPTLASLDSVLQTNDQIIAQSLGHTVTVGFPGDPNAPWERTTEEYAAFDAIVFGDPNCLTDPAVLDLAVANRNVWSPAIQGNIVIMGNSPIDRIRGGDPQGQATQLIRNAINFAASGNGTGLYMSLSCYYFFFTTVQQVDALGGLGDFRVSSVGQPASICPDIVTIAEPDHPVMAGLTEAGLSNWVCSMWEWFNSFPSSFRVLATVAGHPYIIATGEVGVTLQTNPSCNASVGQCSANIVRGDGSDQTNLYISLEPLQQTTVQLSAGFGSVPGSVQTNASGKASATYTSGVAPTDATTAIGRIGASVSGNEGFTEVYNFRGFAEYNFHQTQVPDSRFTADTEWGASEVQAFFVARNSFLACFYLVGTEGDRGFWDTDCNGLYNWVVDVKYCADVQDPDCSLNGPKISAAQAFVNAARKQGQRVNPKLLLVQVQKEQSLVSQTEFPGVQVLNEAFGCPAQTYNTFRKQLDCGANTMADHFNTAPGMPYFSPGTTPNDSIRHFVYNPEAGSLGSKVVGFAMNSKGTYALYRYTPHLTTSQGGGGNYLFEQLWMQYGF